MAAACTALAACSDGAANTASVTEVSITAFMPMTEPLPCDPLDERACLLPWPNDAFTVPDTHTPTGRRLAVAADSTPADVHGRHVPVAQLNTADGFSPGATVLTAVAHLDAVATGLPTKGQSTASVEANAPIVLLDSTNHERLPYWTAVSTPQADGTVLLSIHPESPLPLGHHVIVALRAMKDHDGTVLPRTDAFQAAIDGTPEPPERATPLGDMLASLEANGVHADESLFLAWYFTVSDVEPNHSTSSAPNTYADPVDAALAQQLGLSTPS